jgi:cell division protease FtsH
MEVIDEEVTKILHDADQRAVELLGNQREKLEIITRELVHQEELDEQDITKLIGPSAHPRRPTEALASA